MYPFYLELELTKPVSDYFRNHGYLVKNEIKIGYCRADLVAFKREEVVAIELKLNDWKKGLIQAKNYQLGADFVYLAVPLLKSYSILRKAEYYIKKEGIGFLIVTENNCEVRKIIDAKPSKKKIASIRLKKRKTSKKTSKNDRYSLI